MVDKSVNRVSTSTSSSVSASDEGCGERSVSSSSGSSSSRMASTEAKKSSTFSLFCDKSLARHDTMSWGHLEEGGE